MVTARSLAVPVVTVNGPPAMAPVSVKAPMAKVFAFPLPSFAVPLLVTVVANVTILKTRILNDMGRKEFHENIRYPIHSGCPGFRVAGGIVSANLGLWPAFRYT